MQHFKTFKFYYRFFIWFLLMLLFVNCNIDKTESRFVLLKPSKTHIEVINKIESTDSLNVFRYRNFYNGGGVAIGDINNDGLPDIYLTINRGSNKLYLNQGDLSFTDITSQAGVEGNKPWSTGVVMVDINADGWLDIYVCNAGIEEGSKQDNELYINNKDGTFIESAAKYNLADSGITTHAAFFDYDLDGDLDVYLLNNSFIPVTSLGYNNSRDIRDIDWNVSPFLKGGGDRLLRNDNNMFHDVSQEAGIYGSLIGFGLGVTLGDVNRDGKIDIYVSNDFYERDYLYINQGDGRFIEKSQLQFNHMSHSSMGADMGDINNDGFPEIFVTDMLPENDTRLKETTEFEGFDIYRFKQTRGFHHQYMQNTLQLNNQNNTFSEIAAFANVEASDWSWGALIFDMDGDGFKDIFICNGIYHELTNQDFMNYFANEVVQKMILEGKKEKLSKVVHKMPVRPIKNNVYKNNKNLTFKNITDNWGFKEKTFSNGASYGDLDLDGDLDLVINNVNQPIMIYENKSSDLGNHYIQLELRGKDKNTYAIGAKVFLFSQNEIIYNELIPTRGFQSSVDYTMTIGIGERSKVDSIQVVWPDQTISTLKDVAINKRHKINYGDYSHSTLIVEEEKENKPEWFTELMTSFKSHKEDNYIDYNREVLISKMNSRYGPAIAVGDVNNDNLDDVYIGGAFGFRGQLWIQTKEEDFVSIESPFLDETINFEDTCAKFIDVNNDGNVDLFVGSGGNNPSLSKDQIKDRIYLNNGKGDFVYSEDALPYYESNTSVIAPYDIDQDGDIDFFIGNRLMSGIYGVDPESIVLENIGDGRFVNVTSQKAYELWKSGMITDAAWVDLTGDGIKDLVIVGDWMSPKIYENKNSYLEELPSNITNVKGWWNTIILGDFNNDHLTDFILGNKGTNTIYTGSVSATAKLYINDFDSNGTLDAIHTRELNGKDYPIHVFNELIAQIPSIKKNNINYSQYAKKDITQLFNSQSLENAIIKSVNETHSLVLLNLGNQHFETKKLPNSVQWNSVNTGVVSDFNEDGNLDVLLSGGEDNLKPQFGKLDAGYGELLLGDGQGGFEWIPYFKSGLKIKGVVRNLTPLKIGKKETFLFGINNQQPRLYEFKPLR